MPKLVRFLVFHAGIGFALALASVVSIFWFNIANLNELILSSDYKWIAIFALVILMTITLASVQMGIAIMCLPYEPEGDDADGPTYLRQPPVQRSPVRIPVETDEDLPLSSGRAGLGPPSVHSAMNGGQMPALRVTE